MLIWTEVIIRLTLAAFFGAVIGLERERKNWTAGMRTHMMVCVGSTLIMMVSAFGFSDVLGTAHVVLDPARIAAQVISGIGFIGAGTILFSKQGTIRGLTTASGLWTVAAIGLATGGGMYFAAATTTAIAIIILWLLQPLENRIAKRFRQKTLRIITKSNANPAEMLQELTQNKSFKLLSFSLDKGDDEFIIQLKFENIDFLKVTEVISSLQANPTIKEVFWSN
ncbi:MgtC/SapB family protein [Mucilaginibacter arboris]|uniref:MgtC/SapB family protein n=1 Tax=Mucilaginibacter arboris TaxID=2682090 RepID=A0A7K1SRZ8_9SPHI|nr:MgtC/SapB family protein [Mucilaginibacter arboris]MVN20099.1 MgtC/SapB family protein [Mucilaginibacter arboris]